MSRSIKEQGNSPQNIAMDLQYLAMCLLKYDFCNQENIKPIYDAAGNCKNITDTIWQYKLSSPIQFNLSTMPDHSLPPDIKKVSIFLDVDITGKHYADTIYCPIDKIKFEIDIKAERWNDQSCEIDNFIARWHCDADIDPVTRYTHSLFNISFGGIKMKSKATASGNINSFYGAALILNTPRIVHPPMDVILGVDFILHNFFTKKECEKIMQDKTYQRIVRHSQERLWRPFALSFASHWQNDIATIDESINPLKIFPNLM